MDDQLGIVNELYTLETTDCSPVVGSAHNIGPDLVLPRDLRAISPLTVAAAAERPQPRRIHTTWRGVEQIKCRHCGGFPKLCLLARYLPQIVNEDCQEGNRQYQEIVI